ncbi:MAG: hypothetical protein KAW46_00220 [candidate division Zixibacteria bacterium]|nr:hypothetical protein [candidate division Zixibacteria bacterium]
MNKRNSIVIVAATLLLDATVVIAVDKSPTAKTADIDQMLEQARAAIAERAGEQINWQVISSGGTKGNSTSFGLQGTVGQTSVGEGSSASFGLRHGYWQDFTSGGGTCCMGAIRGNVDMDPGDAIDISDLVFLVDYMFTGGPAPTCWPEANVDGIGPDDASGIDISDLVYLVDYMFNGGPAPPSCP